VGTIDLDNGLLMPAQCAQFFRIPLVGGGVIGIEFDRLLEFGLSSGEVPVVLDFVCSQHGVGMSQGRVQLQGFAGGGIGFGKILAGISKKEMSHRVDVGQPRVSQGVFGILGDRLIEVRNGGRKIRGRALVPGVTAF